MFRSWVTIVWARLRDTGGAGRIAIDGKTSRASWVGERLGTHTFGAWLSDPQLVPSQTEVRAKSNEIEEIPELPRLHDLEGSTVTTDAIGRATVIPQAVIERGGDYLPAGNENHPALRAEIA